MHQDYACTAKQQPVQHDERQTQKGNNRQGTEKTEKDGTNNHSQSLQLKGHNAEH